MKDILGQAIHDHYHQQQEHQLWINNQYGPREEMPVEAYFREEDDMPDIEWLALNECRGDILDIGAGAGAHVLILQERGFDVTALDISNMASTVMKARGVHKVITTNIFEYQDQQYDTLLLLMNGIGLTGTLLQLKIFLKHTQQLLKPVGFLLVILILILYLAIVRAVFRKFTLI